MSETPFTPIDPSDITDRAIERGANYDSLESDFDLHEQPTLDTRALDQAVADTRREARADALRLATPGDIADFEGPQPERAEPFIEVYSIGDLALKLKNVRNKKLGLPQIPSRSPVQQTRSNVIPFRPPTERPSPYNYTSYEDRQSA